MNPQTLLMVSSQITVFWTIYKIRTNQRIDGKNWIQKQSFSGTAGALDRLEFQDYISAEDILESSISDLNDASALSFRLKDQVMLWIFIIEWLTVTATISIAGFVLRTLMIRRRLYEEVESTRFTGS